MFGQSAFAQVPFATKAGTVFSATVAENFSALDSPAYTAGFPLSITEPTTLNNTDSEQDVFYFGNVDAVISDADSSTQQSAFKQSLTENFTSGDSSTQSSTFLQSLTEPFTSSESETANAGFASAITEPFTSGDSSTQSSAFLQSLTEPFTSSETESIAAQFAAAIQENFNPTDIIAITAQFAGSITEALTSLETAVIGSAYFFTQNENTGLTDAYGVNASVYFSLTEGAFLLDAPAITAQFAGSVNEIIALAEHLEQHGWIKIPDAQNANWMAVTNVSYTHEFGMLFGGSPISAVPISSIADREEVVRKKWTPIADAQTPNWKPIKDDQ